MFCHIHTESTICYRAAVRFPAGFVDQVKGYAKEFAGKSFGKEHEQARTYHHTENSMSAPELFVY